MREWSKKHASLKDWETKRSLCFLNVCRNSNLVFIPIQSCLHQHSKVTWIWRILSVKNSFITHTNTFSPSTIKIKSLEEGNTNCTFNRSWIWGNEAEKKHSRRIILVKQSFNAFSSQLEVTEKWTLSMAARGDPSQSLQQCLSLGERSDQLQNQDLSSQKGSLLMIKLRGYSFQSLTLLLFYSIRKIKKIFTFES